MRLLIRNLSQIATPAGTSARRGREMRELAVYENAASLDAARRWVDLIGRSGVAAERWTADQIRDREPAIVGPQVGGYYYPDDAHCEPFGAVKALEAEGLLAARPYSDRPRRVAYVLTASGAELAGALRLLAQWGAVRSTLTL